MCNYEICVRLKGYFLGCFMSGFGVDGWGGGGGGGGWFGVVLYS